LGCALVAAPLLGEVVVPELLPAERLPPEFGAEPPPELPPERLPPELGADPPPLPPAERLVPPFLSAAVSGGGVGLVLSGFTTALLPEEGAGVGVGAGAGAGGSVGAGAASGVDGVDGVAGVAAAGRPADLAGRPLPDGELPGAWLPELDE